MKSQPIVIMIITLLVCNIGCLSISDEVAFVCEPTQANQFPIKSPLIQRYSFAVCNSETAQVQFFNLHLDDLVQITADGEHQLFVYLDDTSVKVVPDDAIEVFARTGCNIEQFCLAEYLENGERATANQIEIQLTQVDEKMVRVVYQLEGDEMQVAILVDYCRLSADSLQFGCLDEATDNVAIGHLGYTFRYSYNTNK